MERENKTERARKAFEAYLNAFYEKNGGCGEIKKEWFWTRAEILEIAVDAYEKTKDPAYYSLIGEMYQGFVKAYGEEWSDNEFNDDIMWIVIACARAYALTGEAIYLQQAVHHFDVVWNRGYSEDLGGGIFWRIENVCKNACINGPALIAACLLYQITKNGMYLKKAWQLYNWQEKVLCTDDGRVMDSIKMDGKVDEICFTYNQGTMIGGAYLLYQITKKDEVLKRAILTADYTVKTLCADGVINTESEGNDQPGFKGILARWLGKLVTDGRQEQYRSWMELNADTAWKNRNKEGLIGTRWNERTEDKKCMAWGCSAAVAQMFAVLEEV